MKIKQLITFKLIFWICVIGIKSQETCENYYFQVLEANVVPRFVGVFKTLEITNAVSMNFSTNLNQYFYAELEENEIRILTTESFENYEKENNSTRIVMNLNIRCSSNSESPVMVRITINSTNNYPPEFTASTYDIKIPTPLAKGTEITAYLDYDDQIAATDYDLYDNRISFTLSGSDLFYVEGVDITGVKSTFKARIFTTQQIIKLENDEVELTLTATDSSTEPQSSSVKVKVFTDPENIFIESPKFSKPFYKGELEKGGTLKIDDLQLDVSTYDDNVKFEVSGDVFGIVNMTTDGPVVKISLKEENLSEEVFQQKFIDFVIEAKRDGDKTGYAVVVIDISSPIFALSFSKSFYEGELKAKGPELTFEEIKISTNGSLDGTSLRLSQSDAQYFEISTNNDLVNITLKQNVLIDEIVAKNILFLMVEAVQNNTVIASANVMIKTISILVPQLEKNFYSASIKNGELLHEKILITEESTSPEEEIEVSLIGTESFNVEVNEREVFLKLKDGAEIPKDKSFLKFEIQVNVKSSSKKSSAVMICELEVTENPEEFLKFNSQLYEGKMSQNLNLSLQEIVLNTVENVEIILSGKHANYFDQQLNENKIQLTLKNGVDIEQFSTDFYLQITIEASRENFTSAISNIIIGIERSTVAESAFEKSLYIGRIDDQRTLKLDNLTIISENLFTDVHVVGDDADFFSASIQNNVITLELILDITENLLLQETILNTKIVAEYEDELLSANIIVTLPRPDEIKKLAFESSYTSGTIKKDSKLILDIVEFSLHPSNYNESVQFTTTGSDAHLFILDQNLNKIQLKLNEDVSEEQLNSKKFISMSVIASLEGFVNAEHFIFINIEIFNSSESVFENSLYVGSVDDQRKLVIDKLSIKSDHEFNSVEFIGDDFEYFDASIEQNQITIRLVKNITEDLLIHKSLLSTKVIAQYNDIVISSNIIVILPRPDEIKKLKFETSYSSGTLIKGTQLSVNIPAFSLHPANYDNTVKFELLGTDAQFFSFEQNSNNIQLKLNQSISEDHLTKEYLTLSVIATKEGFESAEHFVFVNVQALTSSETIFEQSLYIGYIDDQRDLFVDKIVIKSDHEFEDVRLIDDDFEYFNASISQNQITINLIKDITNDLLLRESILSAKVVAQFEDITAYTNFIVTLPRPDEIKKLKFETTHTSGTIRKDSQLILEIDEFSLHPANYNESVRFALNGNDAHLFSFNQTLNKIQLRLNQGISDEELNTKKYLLLSMKASREEFEDAEHFIFINIEIFDPSNTSFENNLFIGQVDDQRRFHLDPIDIKSNHEFSDVQLIDDDFEYFNVSITQNQVTVGLTKEITQALLIEKTILSTKLMAQFDDIVITTNIIVMLPRPDEIQNLKFETSYSIGKIITHPELDLELDEISLQSGNYNESVEFSLNGNNADLFDIVRNANKIQLKLKSETISELLNEKELLSLIVLATRDGFVSAEHFVSIYIEKSNSEASDKFDKSLYIGKIVDQKVLDVELMVIKSDEVFNSVDIVGDDSEFFDASINQNNVTVSLKEAVAQMILPQKGFLSAKILATHEDISIYTNLIVDLPKVDETQRLSFEAPYTVGNLFIRPQLKLEIHEILLESTNYDETVKFNLTGSNADLFDFSTIGNKIKLTEKTGINEESLENKEYFTLTLKATREGFESAEHFIFVNLVTPEIDESNFDQNLYIGSIDNSRVLRLDPLFIKSELTFNEVMVAEDDYEYFAATIDQKFVTIGLVKEITEDLLLKTSLLSTKVIAKSGDILISTNIIVKLPKVNGDKILRFESPYYIGTIDQLALEIEHVVLEMNNYDETVEFTLNGSDKDLFKFEKNQNSIKLSLSSDITEEDLQNRVFLTASITAIRNEFASAETVIFVHLNVIVDEISPIEFDKVIYTGSLTYNNVLELDKISITSNETEIQISHKGDHADKFTIDHSNLGDIQLNFIPQPIDFGRKFYNFYIEALKFGAPKVYAGIIIEIIDKIQLKFDRVNYFGSFDEQENLIIDQIPLNSVMASSGVSFRLVDGQNEFFGLNLNGSTIQITKQMSIAVENLSFVWFYLEAYGSNFYPAKTLIVIDFPQNIDTPIDECYDKLDPTQPYFETGSYSFTIMSDETGLIGQIRAIITDPDDSITSYGLLFENIFLYDKITIDKGDIILSVPIPAGLYRMKGIAISMNSRKSAETTILLRVLEVKACEDGKPITTVQKSLAIVKIEENEIHNQIMYMKIGDCEYEVIKVVPDVLKDHLIIDNTVHYLKNIVPFDREDRVFANYNVPQLQVTLRLICPPSYFIQPEDNRIQPFMNEVLTDEILYSPSVTYLNLEILDQNDNAPVFTNPPYVNFRVAFPDENLIGLIMTKYLFKVEAYDIDDGINAIIRYSTSMPSIFEINAVTGEINPLRTLPDEPTGLLITAIDRQGAGLRSTTSIDFVKISSANVIEIIANNFLNKDVDELALELSEKLKAEFRVLSSSQLPFTTNSQVLRFADTQAKTKIYGYAFKTNSIDLIEPSELIEQLKELDLTFSINYSEVNECSELNKDEDGCDLTIWIFAVSFMGTFLLLILIAIPVFWYFYLKKRLLNKDNHSQSSKEEIANHFYETDSVQDSEIASEIVEAITEMRASDADIMGIGVDGVTEDESSTDADKLSTKLMSILEPSSPIHDRKVKFNEMVERIEVIDDADPDGDDIPEHSRRY